MPNVDLTNCDREPIRVPGAIMPHGAMLVLDCSDFKIVQVAGDTRDLLDRAPEELLGAPANRLFTAEQIERLRSLCSRSSLSVPRHLLDPTLRVGDGPLDASVHRSGEALVLEFEEADLADAYAADPLSCVQEMLADTDQARSLQQFCTLAAERVRSVIGYDRVMIYRFMADGAGWVFAENKADALPPYLDLRYPASDIPRQARELYLQNPLRVIPAVDYDPAPLMPAANPLTGQPLDMSQALLRDVSAIHREYLRNMGVAASMSISIIVRGRLWGLIACHHYEERRVARHLRAICELFGAMFSLQIEARERAEVFEARARSRKLLQEILTALTTDEEYGESILRHADKLLRYIDAGGLALRASPTGGLSIKLESGITSTGETPDDESIRALTDWLSTQMDSHEGIFITDRLPELWPAAAEFSRVGAGLLALSISREPRDFLLWFRPEVTETVRWAGDPNKPVELGPNGPRLTPRKSFEVWTQEVRGRSMPWQETDNDAAFDLRVSLLEIVLRRLDIAVRERARAQERERLLMHELDHRVKNTLANIQALTMYSGRSATSVKEYADNLTSRIMAMSKAHSLLTESRWTQVSIRSLLEGELRQYWGEGGRIVINGDDVGLEPKAALALSLAIHELATNACKYGALSSDAGSLTVSWERADAGGLKLVWQELGGPPVSPPTRRGFGSTLISRALAMETGGRSELRYEPGGLICEIELPSGALSEGALLAPPPLVNESPPHPEPGLPTSKPRVLVVEDSAMIAMSLEDLVDRLGWEVVGPAATVSHAIELVGREQLDVALLDVNLNGDTSWTIADALRSRSVPFLFLTGYDGATVLPDRFADTIVIGKPFNDTELTEKLQDILAVVQPAARCGINCD